MEVGEGVGKSVTNGSFPVVPVSPYPSGPLVLLLLLVVVLEPVERERDVGDGDGVPER